MTTKAHITNYLRSKNRWVSGSELENQSANWSSKASTISRRARELANEGKVEIEYSTRHTVQYRTPQPEKTYSDAKAIAWLN